MADSILVSIPEALKRVSIGRSMLYLLMAEGSIHSVKAGRRRLVDAASLERWAKSLPQQDLKQSARSNDAR
jgi:excisionase family DNA binding protein